MAKPRQSKAEETSEQIGERRHEQCRFGIFSQQAYRIAVGSDVQVPFAMPLCGFVLPEPVPPRLRRGWGGDIDFARDCSVCPAYAPLVAGEA